MVGCCLALSASADPAPNEGLRDFLFPPNQLKAVGPLSFALSKGSSINSEKSCFLLPLKLSSRCSRATCSELLRLAD